MSLPCLEALLASGSPVVVCARPWAEDLLSSYPIKGFVPVSGKLWHDWQSVRSYRRKHHHSDPRGLLLPDSLSSAIIFRLAGIPSAGHKDDGRQLLLRWPLDKARSAQHAVQAWYRLTLLSMQAWGFSSATPLAPPRELKLRLSNNHYDAAQQLIKQQAIHTNSTILIAPTAVGRHHGKNKVWEGFEALTKALQAQRFTVVMCPPPAEREQALANAPSAVCLPSLSLGGFAALAKSCKLVVCNDSGVSHIAAAVGANQLTLFGVTNRKRTGPWSPHAQCLGSEMGWPTVEEVVAKIQTLMAKGAT